MLRFFWCRFESCTGTIRLDHCLSVPYKKSLHEFVLGLFPWKALHFMRGWQIYMRYLYENKVKMFKLFFKLQKALEMFQLFSMEILPVTPRTVIKCKIHNKRQILEWTTFGLPMTVWQNLWYHVTCLVQQWLTKLHSIKVIFILLLNSDVWWTAIERHWFPNWKPYIMRCHSRQYSAVLYFINGTYILEYNTVIF